MPYYEVFSIKRCQRLYNYFVDIAYTGMNILLPLSIEHLTFKFYTVARFLCSKSAYSDVYETAFSEVFSVTKIYPAFKKNGNLQKLSNG